MNRILIVNMYYYPNMIGGTEHSIKILAEGLVGRGYEVAVFTQDAHTESEVLEPETINGVKVFRSYLRSTARIAEGLKLSIFERLKRKVLCIYNASANKQLKYVIDWFEPDVIHANNLVTLSYGVLRYSMQGIVVVHTLRDYWILDPHFDLLSIRGLSLYIHRLIFRRITNKYRNVVVTAPSDRMIHVFKERGFFKNVYIRCIPNCICFDIDEVKLAIESRLRINDEVIRFLYVGKLDEHKGIRNLIDVFADVQKENIDLTICGDGPLKNYVMRAEHKDKRIRFIGQKNADELKSVYRKCDVLIVPSIWEEPFGRIIIEGASEGMAVIGRNKGGIPEIICMLKNGVLYSSDKDLANAIVKLSDRNNIHNYINGIPFGLEEYSLTAHLDRFLDAYKI